MRLNLVINLHPPRGEGSLNSDVWSLWMHARYESPCVSCVGERKENNRELNRAKKRLKGFFFLATNNFASLTNGPIRALGLLEFAHVSLKKKLAGLP